MLELRVHLVDQALERVGDPLTLEVARKLTQRWRECFGVPNKRAHGIRFDWEVFAVGSMPALVRRRAIAAFVSTLRDAEVSVYAWTDDLTFAVAFSGRLDRELAREAEPQEPRQIGDFYIVDTSMTWTFVMTQDQSIGLGPYFAVRESGSPFDIGGADRHTQ